MKLQDIQVSNTFYSNVISKHFEPFYVIRQNMLLKESVDPEN